MLHLREKMGKGPFCILEKTGGDRVNSLFLWKAQCQSAINEPMLNTTGWEKLNWAELRSNIIPHAGARWTNNCFNYCYSIIRFFSSSTNTALALSVFLVNLQMPITGIMLACFAHSIQPFVTSKGKKTTISFKHCEDKGKIYCKVR